MTNSGPDIQGWAAGQALADAEPHGSMHTHQSLPKAKTISEAVTAHTPKPYDPKAVQGLVHRDGVVYMKDRMWGEATPRTPLSDGTGYAKVADSAVMRDSRVWNGRADVSTYEHMIDPAHKGTTYHSRQVEWRNIGEHGSVPGVIRNIEGQQLWHPIHPDQVGRFTAKEVARSGRAAVGAAVEHGMTGAGHAMAAGGAALQSGGRLAMRAGKLGLIATAVGAVGVGGLGIMAVRNAGEGVGIG